MRENAGDTFDRERKSFLGCLEPREIWDNCGEYESELQQNGDCGEYERELPQNSDCGEYERELPQMATWRI